MTVKPLRPPIFWHRQHPDSNDDRISMRRTLLLISHPSCRRRLHSNSSDAYNAFLSHSSQVAIPISELEKGDVFNKTIALKDNICTNDDLPTSCASRMLEGIYQTFRLEFAYDRLLLTFRCHNRFSPERRGCCYYRQDEYGRVRHGQHKYQQPYQRDKSSPR
jgi:hypothetical protein